MSRSQLFFDFELPLREPPALCTNSFSSFFFTDTETVIIFQSHSVVFWFKTSRLNTLWVSRIFCYTEFRGSISKENQETFQLLDTRNILYSEIIFPNIKENFLLSSTRNILHSKEICSNMGENFPSQSEISSIRTEFFRTLKKISYHWTNEILEICLNMGENFLPWNKRDTLHSKWIFPNIKENFLPPNKRNILHSKEIYLNMGENFPP